MATAEIRQHLNKLRILPNTVKSIHSMLRFMNKAVIKKVFDGNFILPTVRKR
jgi:hypothetical protein